MELDRKFRVLGQSNSMHAMLRDRFTQRALAVDMLLLACSVMFCASAFASDSALSHLGPNPEQVRYIIRGFSVLAFTLSVLSLRLDWKGRAASHREAADRMARASATFRRHRRPDGTWPTENAAELDGAYWEAMRNSVPVPEGAFPKLKARHLRKVELSKMLDLNPGCPLVLLRAKLWWLSLKRLSKPGNHDQ